MATKKKAAAKKAKVGKKKTTSVKKNVVKKTKGRTGMIASGGNGSSRAVTSTVPCV